MNLLLFNLVRRCSFSIVYLLFTVFGLLLVEPVKSVPSLVPGDSGGSVIELQKTLSQQGFYTGPIDGYYGEGTKQAVVRFQQVNSLAVDGFAGEQTQSVLQGRLSLAPQSATVQTFGQVGIASTEGIFTGSNVGGMLGLLVISGVGTLAIFRPDPSKKAGYQPFKQWVEFYYKKKHLADLGFFDLDTTVTVTYFHKEISFSISDSAPSKGAVILSDSNLPRGEYNYIAEGIYDGEKVTRKGTFRL